MKTIKKQSVLLLSILFSLTLLFTSCESDENDGSNPDPENFSENWGAMVSRDFMGKIIDENNNPLSDVQVEIGSDMTTTDDNGIFIINDANVYERFAYIKAEKIGYINMSRSMIPTAGVNYADIKAMAEELVNIASGVDSEVNLINGTTVKFDGAFEDENGNAYTGNVSVAVNHLSPSDPDVNKKMPGMLYAQNANNEERILETYGMINVKLIGASGEKLNIASGHTAEIELPIDPSQPSAPSTIELWHFDEDKGYWIEDGTATKVGNKYVGEVSHFSWWNCDAQFPTVDLCMTIEDTNGNPIYGVRVVLTPNGMNPRYGISNGDGEICGLIPSNSTLGMEIFDPCGVSISTSSIGPFSSNTDLGIVTIPAAQTSTISGTLLDCNNNPVTNGYVTLIYNNVELLYTVTNGSFAFNTTTCASINDFTLVGVDYDSFQESDIMNYTFTPPTTNIGNLITCNTIDEFITYQIDNDPVVTLLTNLTGYVQGSSISAGGNDPNNNMLYVSGNSILPGTYNSPNFDIGELNDRDYNVPTTIQFVLSNVGTTVGDYIDMTFSGTYTDTNAVVKNISGTVHVKRDN